MTRLIGPLFLLSGVAMVVAAWWWARGNETTGGPDPSPPPPGLVSFSVHPAANATPDRDGWVAAVEVRTHTIEVLRGTAIHPTMTAALDEARMIAAGRREGSAA